MSNEQHTLSYLTGLSIVTDFATIDPKNLSQILNDHQGDESIDVLLTAIKVQIMSVKSGEKSLDDIDRFFNTIAIERGFFSDADPDLQEELTRFNEVFVPELAKTC